MKTELRTWFSPALLAATIVFASANSQVAGPDLPGIDKVEHFFIYGLLATLLVRVRSVAQSPRLGVWLAVLLASFFGMTDELHQSLTPGRSVELMDWIVDTLGAALAVAIYSRWTIYRVFLELPLAGPQSFTLLPKQISETPS